MKTSAYAILLAGSLLFGSNFDIGISGSNGKVDGFTLSIGDYYQVPYRDVVVVEKRIPRDELGVVYYLSRHAHRDVSFVTDLRLRGLSWWDITLRLGLDPRVLYVVETRRAYGPPYGRAYGHHSKHRLHDREIVDLVNVRFLSDYHRISPDEVIERRRGGDRFDRIDRDYREKRHEIREDRRDMREDRRELRDDRRELREERRDVREDRREFREDRRDDRREDRGHGDKGRGNPHDR